MLSVEVLRAVLLDNTSSVKEIKNKFSTKDIINFLSKSRLKNNFLRLAAFENIDVKKYLTNAKKEYALKSLYTKELSKNLAENDIKHIIFKGGAIASNYYKTIADRPFSDIDILIDLSCYEDFYKFLDKNNLSHKYNYQYLNRIGYTRTAIEVIETAHNLTLDFHFRIQDNFFKNPCVFTKHLLANVRNINNISTVSGELMIPLILHHSIINNKYKTGAYYIVDVKRILENKVNDDLLNQYLNIFGLNEHYKRTKELINNISNYQESSKDREFVDMLFKHERQHKIFHSARSIFSQIFQFIDPKPYINYTGGNVNGNLVMEFFKQKGKRGASRIK